METKQAKLNKYKLECECGNQSTFLMEGKPCEFTIISVGEKWGPFPLTCNQCSKEHYKESLKFIKE